MAEIACFRTSAGPHTIRFPGLTFLGQYSFMTALQVAGVRLVLYSFFTVEYFVVLFECDQSAVSLILVWGIPVLGLL